MALQTLFVYGRTTCTSLSSTFVTLSRCTSVAFERAYLRDRIQPPPDSAHLDFVEVKISRSFIHRLA